MTRPRRAPRLALSGLAAGLVGLALSVPAGAQAGPHARALPPAIGLAGAVGAGGETYVTVLMGSTSGSENLFWQLFSSEPGGRWRIATPPGVADNGGLVTAPSSTGASVLEGFRPSQNLRFSPLGYSADAGRTWSPGGLDLALVDSPGALALSPSGDALALVDPSSPEVLARHGSLTSWSRLVRARTLSNDAALSSCGFEDLDAVALSATGAARFGGACHRAGVLGIVESDAGRLVLAPASVPATERSAQLRVVELEPGGALVTGDGPTGRFIAVARANASGTFVLGAPLDLRANAKVVSASVAADGDAVIDYRAPGAVRAALNSARAPGTWVGIGALPSETAVVFEPTGSSSLEAFSVHGSHLSVFTAARPGARFVPGEKLTVEIAYGSSA